MNDGKAVYDRFLKFRSILIQAIALAWKDESYHVSLKADPKAALKEAFDYDCPFDVDMDSNPDNAAWNMNLQGDWLVYSQNQLTMVLPPKPDNSEDEPIALATYNTKHLTCLG